MDQRVILTSRRKHAIMHRNGFRFCRDRTRNEVQYWRCVSFRDGCSSRFSIRNGVPGNIVNNHNHVPPAEAIADDTLVNNIRKEVKADFSRSAMAVYSRALASVNRPVNVTFKSIKHVVYAERAAAFPPIPHTRQQIVANGIWASTFRNDRFLIPGPNNDILIFATDDNIRVLSSCDFYFMDGTFKSCPSLFMQIFCIHGLYNNYCLPLVICLLPAKSQETYTALFQRLINYAQMLGVNLNPDEIMTDCESGLIPSVAQNFPLALHKICYFHMCQSVYRYISTECGLAVAYRDDADVRSLIRRVCAIAFLPLNVKRVSFNALEAEIINMIADRVIINGLRQFFQYFNNFWMHQIPLTMWSVAGASIRTNNHAEGWNSRINKLIGKIRPPYYEFVLHMKREQCLVESTVLQANNGIDAPRGKKKFIQIEAEIQQAMQRYLHPTAADVATNNVMSASRLLRFIAHRIA